MTVKTVFYIFSDCFAADFLRDDWLENISGYFLLFFFIRDKSFRTEEAERTEKSYTITPFFTLFLKSILPEHILIQRVQHNQQKRKADAKLKHFRRFG